MKVLWLHHRISSSININAAFLNVSSDGFNDGLQPHNKLPWGYCLVVKVYACSKIKIGAAIGAAKGILNSVNPKRKIDKFDNFNHAKNRRANNKKIRMFKNTTISEIKTTIT